MPQFFSGFTALMASGAEESEVMQYYISETMRLYTFAMLMGLVNLLVASIVTWWYLGQKARSKGYLLLLLIPWGIGIIGGLLVRSSMTAFLDTTAISTENRRH